MRFVGADREAKSWFRLVGSGGVRLLAFNNETRDWASLLVVSEPWTDITGNGTKA